MKRVFVIVARLKQGRALTVSRQAPGISPVMSMLNGRIAFDPCLCSQNRNMIPSTAASIGVNPYDPVSALNGAARLMASYYQQYGDYAKALAAYNAGSGTVNYAIQAGGANWMSFLPAATRNYIFKIMAI